MKTVRIYGMSSGLALAPPVGPGIDVWAMNDPSIAYRKFRPRARQEYTCWFNLHSRRHMDETYPNGVAWYRAQTKPIVMQERQADIPASEPFPQGALLSFFGHRYFTLTVCWLIALAIFHQFERIELYGFEMRGSYARHRPCFFYWVEEARRRGIGVFYPAAVGDGAGEAGDPLVYTGPLYGYETT